MSDRRAHRAGHRRPHRRRPRRRRDLVLGAGEDASSAVTDEHVVVARGRELAWLDRDDLDVVAVTPTSGIEALAALAGTDTVVVKAGVLLATLAPGDAVVGGLKVAVHGVTKIVPG